jgi:DNA-binding LacI/PurR family transcriptional regulator
LPSIDGLHQALEQEGLSVLLVNIGESRQTVVRTASSRRYAAPVLLDPSGKAADIFGVRGTPTVFIIGRDGTILGSAVGPLDWTERAGLALLKALLRARP